MAAQSSIQTPTSFLNLTVKLAFKESLAKDRAISRRDWSPQGSTRQSLDSQKKVSCPL